MKKVFRCGDKDILERFIYLANEIMFRSEILCSLYLTKTGILRIIDDEDRKTIKDHENKITCNHRAIEWVMDALTTINDEFYPRSSIEETKELQSLAHMLLYQE